MDPRRPDIIRLDRAKRRRLAERNRVEVHHQRLYHERDLSREEFLYRLRSERLLSE